LLRALHEPRRRGDRREQVAGPGQRLVVDVEAEHPDDVAARVADEEGRRAERAAGARLRQVVREVVAVVVLVVLQHLEHEVGRGAADAAAADVPVREGDDRAAEVARVVQHDLGARAEQLGEEVHQRQVRPELGPEHAAAVDHGGAAGCRHGPQVTGV
jgi:hypothetical protein